MTDKIESLRDLIEEYVPSTLERGDLLKEETWTPIVDSIPIDLLKQILDTKQSGNWNPFFYELALIRVAQVENNISKQALESLANTRIVFLNLLRESRYYVEVRPEHLEYCRRRRESPDGKI